MDSVFDVAFKLVLHRFREAAFGPVIMEVDRYLRAQGIDPALASAHAGHVSGFHCIFDDAGLFHFEHDGEQSLVFEVLDEDGATVIDLCAFSIANPNRFGTAMGAAAVLGETNVTNPASWALGKVLPIHRTPLDWLRDGCRGAVILDQRRAPAVLGNALGKLLAADEAHARSLRGMLCSPPVDPANIIFKASARRAA